MTSLLDIGPLTEEVEVRGVKLEVQGLTAGHLFQLFAEFPDMRKLLDKKQGSPQQVMLSLAPELIAKVIAMALGKPRDKEVEAKVMTMGAGDQLNIVTAVVRLSFNDGIGPFVEQVTKLMNSAAPKFSATPSAISSNSMTDSPAPFSASLQTDSPPSLRGHVRRVN
jgi:hypothetical protein